jgi:hypothetical protein
MAGMSTTNPNRPGAPGAPGAPRAPEPGRPVLAAGALAAAQAATASLVIVLVPVVLAWATAPYSRAPWGQAVRVGVDAWLLAHHAGIAVAGGHVGLVPLGLLLVPLLSCWFAGVRLARAIDPNAEAVRAGIGRAAPAWPPPRALLALVVTYASLVTLAGALATTPTARPLVAQAFAGAAVISALAGVTGAAAWVAGGLRPGLRLGLDLLRLPAPVRRCLGPAGAALAVHLGGALILLLAALATGWDRVLLLHRALEPGLAGGLVLIVGQLTVVPNLLVWAASFAAGPGFAVGTGTAVLPGRVDLGALPAVPVLGALPTPGSAPAWAWALLALPVLAGVGAGGLLLRADREAGVTELLRDAGLTALLVGTAWALLGWLAGGPAGPGRLATLGPSPWQLGAAATLEVGVGAALAVGLGLLMERLAGAGFRGFRGSG